MSAEFALIARNLKDGSEQLLCIGAGSYNLEEYMRAVVGVVDKEGQDFNYLNLADWKDFISLTEKNLTAELREFFENMPADADDDTIKPSLYTQIGFLVDEFYEDAPESYVVEGSIIYDWYLNNEAVMDAFRNPEVSVELLF